MGNRNFHVPLSEELHAMLHREAARRGRRGTQLVREILEEQLRAMQADSVDQDLTRYVASAAQSSQDEPGDGAQELWELLKDDEW